MNAVDILEKAAAEGVILTLCLPDAISVAGDQSAVDKWLPVVRNNKPDLVLALHETERWREFMALLRSVGPAYNTPAHEYAELQATARGDLDGALMAFREMAQQVRS